MKLKRLVFGLLAVCLSGAALAQTVLPPYITGTNDQNKQSVFEVGILRLARNTGITATPSGTLANSYVLNKSMNVVSTVATGDDSVTLPTISGSVIIIVANTSATTMKVWPNSSTATINAITAGGGMQLVAKARVAFIQLTDGAWYTLPLLPS